MTEREYIDSLPNDLWVKAVNRITDTCQCCGFNDYRSLCRPDRCDEGIAEWLKREHTDNDKKQI